MSASKQAERPIDFGRLLTVLDAIGRLAGDDFCSDFDVEAVFRPGGLTEREKIAQQKLSAIYRLAHSFNPRYSCHHVHKLWRDELAKYGEVEHHG